MKRLVVVIMVAGVLAVSIGNAEARRKRRPKTPYVRVFEGHYDNPAIGIGGVVTYGGAGGYVTNLSLANEKFLNVEIIDDAGMDAYFGVGQQDTNGDGIGEIVAGGCGKLAAPIEIVPGYTYSVTVTMGPGTEAPTCPGVATAGTIKMTFTEESK